MADRPLDLGWLRILTEVGRTGNLTAAAQRLRLTQPGVSYQIKRIEEELGVPLLLRHHRGVDLTPEGQRLFELAARQVAEIDHLARDIRRRPRTPTIRLHTDYAFSSLWLMPRMQDFRTLHPEINIQIVATQNPLGQPTQEEDVMVFFGARAEAENDSVLLLSEKVTPVCAPGFRDRLPEGFSLDDLARSKLIHLDSASASWFDWNAFFAQLGHPRPVDKEQGDISFNTYSLVIQAAMSEQGVALGWTGLIDDMIASGALVEVGPTVEATDRGYWLSAAKPGDAASKLVGWLQAQ
ncbi:MAG: LysR family transcriptional regulator [Alphaproteobacteria bacterium]|nr:MAG: LysR family transcriptional regulator [Alphaproteobacteria bacterium]